MSTKKYISDELLASYIHHNTTPEQNEEVMCALCDSPDAFEEYHIASMAAAMLDDDFDHEPAGDPDLNKPAVNTAGLVVLGGVTGKVIGNVFESSRVPMVAASDEDMRDRFMPLDSSIIEKLEKMENNTYPAPTQYGDRAQIDVSSDIYQWYPDTCAIKSQQIILEKYGIHLTQEQLIEEATLNSWYSSGNGTQLANVGNLLSHHGVDIVQMNGANEYNIVSEIVQGHQVIVCIDSQELGNNKIWEGIKEFFTGRTPDHALIVAGIDTTDKEHPYVILQDPGTGDVAKPYPLDKFMAAWEDSGCYMVSTQMPAPLAYNPTMVNFDYETGHLPYVDSMSYDDFVCRVAEEVACMPTCCMEQECDTDSSDNVASFEFGCVDYDTTNFDFTDNENDPVL